MNVVAMIMLVFSMLGAIDRIIGNRFGLGQEFENGFLMFGKSALSMIGMIVISPWIAEALTPVFSGIWEVFRIDPSVIPASLFANDMGGAPLSVEVAADPLIGKFNALIVSSMMGVTISFTVPYALGVVDAKLHRWLLLGLLCGVVTVPAGCLVGGMMLRISFGTLVYNLLPSILFSGISGIGLLKFPDACVKIFSIFAVLIKAVITVGLAIGIIDFLTDFKLIKNMATLEEGAAICLNASVVMSGAFPLVYVLSKVLAKPLQAVGKILKVNEISAVGFLSSLASSITTFGVMNKMDEKGAMLNSAFAVSAAFVFAGHLAFTMAWDTAYLPAMIVGKLVAGFLALGVALFLYQRINKGS
jgi:ethanolamine transporter